MHYETEGESSVVTYLGEVHKLLTRDGEELEVGSVGHHVGNEVLDVVGIALKPAINLINPLRKFLI